MTGLATYFYPAIFESTRPLEQLAFNGYAVPHFQRVFTAVERRLAGRYPALPYRKADLADYARVHDPAYLEALEALSQDRPVAKKPYLNAECHHFWYVLPGYTVSLGGMLEAIDQMRRGRIQRAYVQSLCGHHAYRDWGHGYCLLNPLAAAARYALDRCWTMPAGMTVRCCPSLVVVIGKRSPSARQWPMWRLWRLIAVNSRPVG